MYNKLFSCLVISCGSFEALHVGAVAELSLGVASVHLEFAGLGSPVLVLLLIGQVLNREIEHCLVDSCGTL